jgi:hypothetical protein
MKLASGAPSRTAACLLALALVSSGCSFRLLRPAPPRAEWPNPVLPSSSEEQCTDSALPVVADATFGAIFGSLAYIERNSGSPKVAFGIGVAAVPLLISAAYGAVTVSRCRSYKKLFIDPATGGHI